jgi:hypothetical protein
MNEPESCQDNPDSVYQQGSVEVLKDHRTAVACNLEVLHEPTKVTADEKDVRIWPKIRSTRPCEKFGWHSWRRYQAELGNALCWRAACEIRRIS